MPISQQIGASRLIQPGVCTSTTRPASPFEGQAIFETDTDRMLIWNGSSWVIPNQVTQNPEGLELIKVQSVGTTVSSVTLSDVFSSGYDSYRVVYGGGVGSVIAGLGLRVGGSTTNYSHVLHWSTPGGTGVNLDSSTNTSQANYLGGFSTGSATLVCDIHNPFLSSLYTTFSTGSYIAGDMGTCHARHNIAQSNTSLTMLALSGTVSGGQISVYGYRKML